MTREILLECPISKNFGSMTVQKMGGEKENKETGLTIWKWSLAQQHREKMVLYIKYICNACALQPVKWAGILPALEI